MVDIQTVLTYLTLISIPVGVFYHILTLRNQSKARQIQIIQSAEVFGDEVWKLWQIDTTDTDAFIEDFFKPEFKSRKLFLDYFSQLETLGAYYRNGVLDLGILASMTGSAIVTMYEKYEAIIQKQRGLMGGEKWFSEAEYLYNGIKDYMKKHPEA